jgi:hypothetical protein
MMALTQEAAAQAGQIAAQLTVLQTALAQAQAALAAGMTIENYQAAGLVNGQQAAFNCPYQFDSTDSATILNALIGIFNSNIAALNSQLAAM